MTTVDSWPVEVSLHAEDGKTRAEARLTKDGAGMIGHGLARRNPDDQEVTQIGASRRAENSSGDGPCHRPGQRGTVRRGSGCRSCA
jgi:hypothetical protein